MQIVIVERSIGSNSGVTWLSRGLSAIWSGQGHSVRLAGDEPAPCTPENILLVLGNFNWYPKLRRWYVAQPARSRPRLVQWLSEPLPPSRGANLRWPTLTMREMAKIALRDARATDIYTNYLLLRSLHRKGAAGRIIVTTEGRREFLEEHGIPAHCVPLGYTQELGRPLGSVRDIDVMFLGALEVPRRRNMLRELERQGLRVLFVGSWSDPAYWGEKRTALLNRAKILLNFSRTPGEMSGFRFILGMSNQALVVSEPIYKPRPFSEGIHFISGEFQQIPALVNRFLADEAARLEIVDQAYQFLTREATLEVSAASVLKVAQTTDLLC